jgi:PAS domain S-box-containing protein
MTAEYQHMSQAELFEILHSLQDEPRVRRAAAEAERLLQELQVHQIELELQNRELREAQQLLEESRSRYADLFDRAPIGYCTFAENCSIGEVNLTAAAMLGIQRERLAADSVAALLASKERERLAQHLHDCFAHGRDVTTELTLRVTEHGPLIVQMASTPVFGLGGKVVATRTTMTDISALKHAERVLRFLVAASETLVSGLDYEATLSEVVRQTVPGFADVCVLDLLADDGRVRRLEIALADSSYTELAHQLKHVADPAPENSVQAHVLRSGAPLLILDRSAASVTTAMLEAAGPARSVMVIPIAIRERVLGVMTFVMTRSNRVYSAKELTLALDLGRRAALAIDNGRAYRAAQSAAKSRDEVLAVVAHDLKSPLSAIVLGASTLLTRAPDDDRRRGRRQLEAIRRASERMARMIGDLVDVTSLEAGHLSIQLAEHAAQDLITDAAALLYPVAQAKGVVFRVEPPPKGLSVACDRGRLLQVLSNLGDNALKFTPRDHTVVLSARKRDDRTEFSVCDTGPGIEKDDLPRVFDRYWQASASTHKGSGLGLYIAKHMVEAQGGDISVESQPGAGTTFRVVLPSRLQQSLKTQAKSTKAGGADVPAGSAPLDATILIVDDDADLREALVDVLANKGYRVVQAGHGGEALDYLNASATLPALILLDLQMPHMDGRQLMKVLKKDPRHASIPVVLVSSQPDTRQLAQALGAAAYLEKPIEIAPLLQSVESHHA